MNIKKSWKYNENQSHKRILQYVYIYVKFKSRQNEIK